jgi:eukaryotic-like serine/threonine-protein kinase
MSDFLPGQTLGTIELERILGQSHTAQTFLAHRSGKQSSFAIKILREDVCQETIAIDRVKAIFAKAQPLRHDHIHSPSRLEEAASRSYILSNFAPGGSVRTLLEKQQPISIADCVSISRQVALALEYAKTQNVVHAGIKPENILLRTPQSGANLHCLVSDFGMVRVATGRFLDGWDHYHYMSPEQCRGANLEPSSDIYSLGVVMYLMLTLTLPFAATNAMEARLKHLNSLPASLKDNRQEIPDDLEDLVLRCMHKTADKRPDPIPFPPLPPLRFPSPQTLPYPRLCLPLRWRRQHLPFPRRWGPAYRFPIHRPTHVFRFLCTTAPWFQSWN